jgi:hypothetical protein
VSATGRALQLFRSRFYLRNFIVAGVDPRLFAVDLQPGIRLMVRHDAQGGAAEPSGITA